MAGITYLDGLEGHHYMDKVLTERDFGKSRAYLIDSRGFLIDPASWDETFAINKAEELKMPWLLDERHWVIIYYLRDKFEKNGVIPTIYQVCNDNGLKLGKLEELFPDGYHRGAVKLAGLRLRDSFN